MIRSSLMFCAEGITRDAETNAISAFTIIEEIAPEGLPLILTRFTVFALLHRDTGDRTVINCTLRISIGNKILFEQPVKANFQDKKRNRTIVSIRGLVIPDFGTLEVSLWLRQNLLNKSEILVHEPRKPKVDTRQG